MIRALMILPLACAIVLPPPIDGSARAEGSYGAGRAAHSNAHKHKGKKRPQTVRASANPALRDAWDQCNDDDANTSIQGCTVVIQSPAETPSNKAVALFNRGTSYLSVDQYANAVQDYSEAIKRNPTDAETFNNRGEAFRALGNKQMADADFRKARELDPDMPDP